MQRGGGAQLRRRPGRRVVALAPLLLQGVAVSPADGLNADVAADAAAEVATPGPNRFRARAEIPKGGNATEEAGRRGGLSQ